MLEKWNRWEPIEGIPEKMTMESLCFDKNGTLIVLESEDGDTKVHILFEDSVLSLRNTDEGRRLKTINFLENMYGTDYYTSWTLFKVTNSTFVEWFNEETYNIYADYNIEHYVFLTSDEVVEVLSTYSPSVKVFK